jgi:hypothetical protein
MLAPGAPITLTKLTHCSPTQPITPTTKYPIAAVPTYFITSLTHSMPSVGIIDASCLDHPKARGLLG